MSNKYFDYLHESREEDDIKRAIEKTKMDYRRKRRDIKQKIADAKIKYAEHAETVGHALAKEIIGHFEEELIELQETFVSKIGYLLSRLKMLQSKGGVKTGVAVIAVTAILLGSYQLYKKYIQAYSEQCKGKQGLDKILCYRRARLKALEQRIIYLKRSMNSECKKTRNPTLCKIRVANEIEKLNIKVEKYRNLI